MAPSCRRSLGNSASARPSTSNLRFERLHPKPEWASRRVNTQVPTMHRLLASTASFLGREGFGEDRPLLPSSIIDIQRLRNAESAAPEEGGGSGQAGIADLVWHPSAKLPVLATAGVDRRVRFYNVSDEAPTSSDLQIDGHTNAPLLTLHIPSLPVSRLSFHPSGSSLLLTGSRAFYYSYDLASQTIIQIGRAHV